MLAGERDRHDEIQHGYPRGRVSTASDTFHCDIGIKDGRTHRSGEDSGRADSVIGAHGKWVLSGGIDSHVLGRTGGKSGRLACKQPAR